MIVINGNKMIRTKAKPFLARPETIADARSAHNPAANLAAHAECSLAYVSEVK
jgi:hypothetical protein